MFQTQILRKAYGHTAPSDKLNIAGVGVGGMGRRNLSNMKTENIVALCDIDDRYAAKTFNLIKLKYSTKKIRIFRY